VSAAPTPQAPLLEVLAPLGFEARALRRGLAGAQVVRTGAGVRHARRAARKLAGSPARSVAIAGVCGALDRDLRPGDVVVASELRGGDETIACQTARALCEALAAAGISAEPVPLLSVDHMVRGRERRTLRASGARAVDMESAWLAEGAAGRPLAVLRVVVDGPGRELLRPGSVLRGLRALRTLRRAAPALESWARAVGTRP
jgi:4-hydroxy-3-methylbut-2-enyl diphosphate reductase